MVGHRTITGGRLVHNLDNSSTVLLPVRRLRRPPPRRRPQASGQKRNFIENCIDLGSFWISVILPKLQLAECT